MRRHADHTGPPEGKRGRKRRERVDSIAKSALGLFLERGIESVTIDEICKAAGLAKGSFYRYFSSKEALVQALVALPAQALSQAFNECEARIREADSWVALQSAYQALAFSLLSIALAHTDVLRLYLQERAAPPVGARAPLGALSNAIEEGALRLTQIAVERGLIEVTHPRLSSLIVIGAVERLAHAALTGRINVTPFEMISTLIRIILEGIRPTPVLSSSRRPTTSP
ncbi:MAG: helix-turn-helix domain-containing protein [Sandaracinaceae bacterium]|nr:helix-turn-helix domain-containing protein [Sandaracinaceae bacterium]